MSYFLIINPASNHKRAAKKIPELLSELQIRNIDFEYKFTKSFDDAYLLSKEVNEKGIDIVVAVGGDGTINKVINGFYDCHGKKISTAKLGVIHTGTSPDFCKSYGIPTKSLSALETLLKGFSKKISVARIEYHTKLGENKIGCFACCSSFGLGALVAHTSNSGIRKYLGDTCGTFLSILISLSGYKASDLRMLCDGRSVITKNNYNTFIGKTSYIASGMRVAHNLSSDEDRLYILSIKSLNVLNITPALRAIYSGKAIFNKDYISYSYAKSIEIFNDSNNNQVEFDGDPQGFLPCKISIAQDKLELIANEL